ncbi:hypothetical protein [Kineobactrum salinum]|uniref:Uncharacterized protein n=1 Tax=Kineobactrum salinum TaxID=2708301 RepID=A0A6C0U0Y9_9GAMM|nr:hypothetical protein [Kineobactrum salinum]QIB65770.1 hypothetical protein G3T16_10425 [Kineobactrum salinum]
MPVHVSIAANRRLENLSMLVFATNALVVTLAVLLHYEFLHWLTVLLIQSRFAGPEDLLWN